MTAHSDTAAPSNFAAGIGSVRRLVVLLRGTTPLDVQIPRKMHVKETNFADSITSRPHGAPLSKRQSMWQGREAGPSGSKKEPGNRTTGDPANLGNPDAEKESRIRRGENRGRGGYLLRDSGLTCPGSTILHNA